MKTAFSRIRFAGMLWSLGLACAVLLFFIPVSAAPPPDQMTSVVDDSLG